MKKKVMFCFTGLLAVTCLLLVSSTALANGAVSSPDFLTDTTDYSGDVLGGDNLGYWMANWDNTTGASGAVATNSLSTLPAWAVLDNAFDAAPVFPANGSYSWATKPGPPPAFGLVNDVTSKSSTGANTFNSLTLPDGTTGVSGIAIDDSEAGNLGQSNNILGDPDLNGGGDGDSGLIMGAGAPSSFYITVIADSQDAGTAVGVRRVKVRTYSAGGGNEVEANTGNGIDGTRNNIADGYRFLVQGINAGDIIRIQLRSSNTVGASALGTGFAGFILTSAVPEPSSIALSLLGLIGVVGYGVRRRRS